MEDLYICAECRKQMPNTVEGLKVYFQNRQLYFHKSCWAKASALLEVVG